MRLLSLFVGVLFPLFVSGQVDEYLVSYSVTEESQAAFISWTTSAGFQCEDIVIEHGVDSSNLNPIYTYPGICGSTDKEEKYNFVFRSIEFNKPNYFRINLGRFGKSPLLEITVISADGLNPKVYPNPATKNSTLLFQNSNRDIVTVTMYSLDGKMAGTQVQTQEESLSLEEFDLFVAGFYFYVIELKGVKLRGKFYLL